MLFVMFTYQHKWAYIFTSRPLRPTTAAQTKWSSFSQDLRRAMYRINVQSRSHATLYIQATMRASHAGDIYIQAK